MKARASARKEVPQAILRSNAASEWHGQTAGHATWSIYQGAAADVLQTLPADSIHCAITSPPYYWLRDYGVKGQIGLEETVEGYVLAIADVMDQIHRVLRPDGLLFLNLGDTYYSGKGKSHGTDRFDTNVRQRGARFLLTNPRPSSKEFRPHQYWKWAATELYEAYSRICAYSCMYLPVPSGTIDHFKPKSARPDLAYEWTNYRLAHHRLNSNKGENQILDPFVVKPGWFVLDFPSCLVRPGEALPKATEEQAIETIKVLRLNDDDALVQERCEVMVSWAEAM